MEQEREKPQRPEADPDYSRLETPVPPHGDPLADEIPPRDPHARREEQPGDTPRPGEKAAW